MRATRARAACLQGAGLPAPEQQLPILPKGRDLRVLYKTGICSVESLCLLRTPMSRGLPLLQGQEGVSHHLDTWDGLGSSEP